MRYLGAAESRRLVNAADPEVRPLVRAALLTGMRWGEICALTVADYNDNAGTVHVRESKSGKPRHISLTDEGIALFRGLVLGRPGTARMFTKADGSTWNKSHQHRPMRAACEGASLTPPISFHGLRNSYGAMLAMAGTSLQVIAALLGHRDTRVTEKHYAHLAPSHVADVLRANLPPIGGREAKPVNVVGIGR